MADVDKKPCSCCREFISIEATTCFHCGRNQNILKRFLNPTSQWIALIISVILVSLSWAQFNEARSQRESANEALNRAKTAEERVTKVASATLPIFESLLGTTGVASGGYSKKEMENLIRPLKEALKQNKIP